MQVCLFGLGEAGSLFASDLVSAGVEVHAFDPANVPTPEGVIRHAGPTTATVRADVVISLTAAADAMQAMLQAHDAIPEGAIYADLSTSAPALKVRIGNHLADERRGVLFADVALLGMVPGAGLATPAMASGSGAQHFADVMNPLGADIEAIDGPPGRAAGRKLRRSVFMKGVSAVLLEALRAGRAADDDIWLLHHLAAEVTNADTAWLERLITGVEPHAVRRLHEMEAAEEMLVELGIDPVMTRATVEQLRRVPNDGVPDIAARD